MSLSTFLRGAALAVTALALGCSAASAAEPAKLNDKQRAKGVADAPALIQTAGVPCDPADAYSVGESSQKSADGKTVKLQVVEVACKAGGGYLLSKNTATNTVNAFNCTQAFSQNAADPKQVKCALPANEKHFVWLTPIVKSYDAGCTVSNARWLGAVTEHKFDRYEIACEGRPGVVVDVPFAGSDTKLAFSNCLIAKGNSACQFTTAEQAVQSLQDPVKQGQLPCTVEKARWLGRSTADNADFYEVGCAGKPGFILQTDTALKYKANFGCDRAGTLGPCQFTDAASLTAGARDAYTQKLKTAGITCTIGDFNVVGVETATKRELVEFKCPEQKFGLAAFIPTEGSTAKFEAMDCFTMISRRKECGFVTKATLDQHLDTLIKGAKKDCDIQQINYLGRGDDDAALVEIACTNKRGYVGAVMKARTGFEEVVSCNIAKSRKYPIQCEIPGNGTYVPPAGGSND
ncbi:hypothetical protein [Asticcacaulis sp. AND118]|uniref:hypothetical protein n=1 Tax=Asticcacaulis sp. AND118 TaxID=2840468 RepID=UPI001CFFBA37|nr:hypothetical protein [Asticcacaulis sp. AND118]UDF02656.1 hypothetical protein LH365_09435 [Asticcacaulis sp. AND118]